MTDLEFSREAVGVKAKQNWHDSETFAVIGGQAGRLDPVSPFKDLPVIPAGGVASLRKTFSTFCLDMEKVLMEFSDACAILGSGTNSAVSNMDDTEETTSEQFIELSRRMGGVPS
ncbi:MAG: hypothetical protein Q4D89_09105 [Arachnia propionica]|uniref:hypothetical protein n=1 Tax=Arachnia propionica TaxID=1750 RepID=UPI002700F333|nr:hypothetical protein [Arachnia propionica]